MLNDETVSTTPAMGSPAPERDLAPISPVKKAAAAADDLLPLPQQTENAIRLEPTKRETTWGEKAFNWLTYGGVGLVGNEAASLAIMKQVRKADPANNIAEGYFFKRFDRFSTRFSDLAKYKHMPEYVTKRMPQLLLATLGGMLMVLPIKWLEDNKGSIVRKLDRHHYGTKADTDPHMLAVHEEMDQAPHQSWNSLVKGRVITVLSAIAADATFGWRESLTAKAPALQNNKYRSLDHVGDEISAGVLKAMGKPVNKDAANFKTLHDATWLLTLSASLTALFYVTSKMFAKNNAVIKEKRLEKRAAAAHEAPDMDADVQTPDTAHAAPKAEVSHITYDKPLAQPQQAAQLG